MLVLRVVNMRNGQDTLSIVKRQPRYINLDGHAIKHERVRVKPQPETIMPLPDEIESQVEPLRGRLVWIQHLLPFESTTPAANLRRPTIGTLMDVDCSGNVWVKDLLAPPESVLVPYLQTEIEMLDPITLFGPTRILPFQVQKSGQQCTGPYLKATHSNTTDKLVALVVSKDTEDLHPTLAGNERPVRPLGLLMFDFKPMRT